MKIKPILPILLAITLVVVIFSGCNFRILYNDYSYGNSAWIKVGETLYKNKTEWVRLDSIVTEAIDTIDYAFFTAYVDSDEYRISVKEGQVFEFYSNFSIQEYAVLSCITIEDSRAEFAINVDFYGPYVDKPNIYIYPTKKTRMTVSLDLPEGGKVTESIPDYPKKWKNIRVKPDGTINNKYEFLFYEADLPGDWQKDEGWCVAQKDLSFFFKTNLRDYGFNKKEIKDFTDWWIPRLKDKPYYRIYPQHTAKINEIVPLKINKNVDSLLRLFYFIEGSDANMKLKKPQILSFERKGFVVTEWGVSIR